MSENAKLDIGWSDVPKTSAEWDSRRALVTIETPRTFAEALEGSSENNEDIFRVRAETALRMLMFIFRDGPHPGWTMRNLYILAHRLKPELLQGMPVESSGAMFGETREAFQARVRIMLARDFLGERHTKRATRFCR